MLKSFITGLGGLGLFLLAAVGAVPSTPQNVTAQSIPCGGYITISWDEVSGATGYKVFRNSNDTPIYNGSATSYADTRTQGTSASYKVKAVNSFGGSPLSASVTATASSACDTTNSGSGTGTTDTTTTTGTSGNTTSDSTATTGTTQTTTATPTNTTTTTSAPQTPANVKVVSGPYCGGQVTISWDQAAGATSYKLYRNSGDTPIYSGSATSYTDTRTVGTLTSYKVKAVNSSGNSALSAAVSGTASPACVSSVSCSGIQADNPDVIIAPGVSSVKWAAAANVGMSLNAQYSWSVDGGAEISNALNNPLWAYYRTSGIKNATIVVKEKKDQTGEISVSAKCSMNVSVAGTVSTSTPINNLPKITFYLGAYKTKPATSTVFYYVPNPITLYWDSDAVSCNGTGGWSGLKPPSYPVGGIIVSPTTTTPYTLTCYNAFGSSKASFTAIYSAAPVVLDKTPPVISGIYGINSTPEYVNIAWKTDEEGENRIEYGSTQSYGQSTIVPASAPDPSLLLGGYSFITPLRITYGTPLHFRIKASDVSGNSSYSKDYYLMTDASGTVSSSTVQNIPVGYNTSGGGGSTSPSLVPTLGPNPIQTPSDGKACYISLDIAETNQATSPRFSFGSALSVKGDYDAYVHPYGPDADFVLDVRDSAGVAIGEYSLRAPRPVFHEVFYDKSKSRMSYPAVSHIRTFVPYDQRINRIYVINGDSHQLIASPTNYIPKPCN
jgi:hypothetical protein